MEGIIHHNSGKKQNTKTPILISIKNKGRKHKRSLRQFVFSKIIQSKIRTPRQWQEQQYKNIRIK
jgi:hypothetical protein